MRELFELVMSGALSAVCLPLGYKGKTGWRSRQAEVLFGCFLFRLDPEEIEEVHFPQNGSEFPLAHKMLRPRKQCFSMSPIQGLILYICVRACNC
jgi:hypothetical protein